MIYEHVRVVSVSTLCSILILFAITCNSSGLVFQSAVFLSSSSSGRLVVSCLLLQIGHSGVVVFRVVHDRAQGIQGLDGDGQSAQHHATVLHLHHLIRQPQGPQRLMLNDQITQTEVLKLLLYHSVIQAEVLKYLMKKHFICNTI